MIRRVQRDEDGAILLMALIFLTVAAIVSAALLSFADTDFRTTINIRDQGKLVYATDAAVEAAINAYRVAPSCASPFTGPTVNEVSGVTVTCSEEMITTTGGASSAHVPPLAVITRPTQAGTNEEPGVRTVSGATTFVRGGLYSHTSIDTSGGSASATGGSRLNVIGPVLARKGCDLAKVTSSPISPDCSYTGAEGADPDYAAEVTTAPPVRSVPACPDTGSVVFQPGSYINGAALNSLFSTCAGRLFHFPPKSDGTVGAYYFDFADTSLAAHEWKISNPATIVVGGTLALGTTGKRCDEDSAGVQFIFGNDSRLFLEAGTVELCGQNDPTATKPEIAVYGLKTGEPIPLPPVATDLPAKTPSNSDSTHFQPDDNGRVQDDITADATVVSTSPATTHEITLSGFDVSTIPDGSTINKVEVVLRHKNHLVSPSNATLDGNLTLGGTISSPTGGSVSMGDRTPTCGLACLTKEDALHDDTFDVTDTFATVAKLSGLSVRYTAQATKTTGRDGADSTFTDSLDGVLLKVRYTPPLPYLRAQSSCITLAPYDPETATCALIRTGGSNADLAIHGTVYAPLAALDVHVVTESYQVFRRGVVVRHLRSNITSSTDCETTTTDACYAFQLPTVTTTPSIGDVVFVATLDGKTRLRALVRFTGAAAPTVKAWSVVNE